MHIQEIRNAADWAALSTEWNGLLRESHNNVPFLTYEFQRAWWVQLGGGEWKTGELSILVGRSEAGSLIGIAPLFSTKIDEKNILQFIGSHEIADFLDLIVRPQDHSVFASAVMDHLAQAAIEWDKVELFNLVDQSRTISALKQATERHGLTWNEETLQSSPFIYVPESFEDYLNLLDSKQAHEVRRKLRRAERNLNLTSSEIVREPSKLDAALEDFFRLMGQESDKALFLKPAMKEQMTAIARAAFKAGWLQLFFLKSGDARIAGYMNFDYDNCIWAYNAGFDNAYAELSPGWLIFAEMMKWSIENKRRIFDFMRGDEEYKYRFGGKDRFVKKIEIVKRN